MTNPGQSTAAAGDSPFAFTYEEFSEWYRDLTSNLLEPARLTFCRLLNNRLDQELTDFDRHRIRVSASRVKRPTRTWAKLTKDQYRAAVTDLDSVLSIVDDLVGLRITCNNLSDIEFFQSLLSDLPSRDDEPSSPLSLDLDSEKLYFRNPKPSGYRAYHINLLTVVPNLQGVQHVQGELQVRTLLQDGWGELTHEDTYKPGMHLPPLIVTLSRRMADLLATVDDLAQDLRDELDVLAQAAAKADVSAETPPSASPSITHDPPEPDDVEVSASYESSFRQVLLDETKRAVDDLSRPASLAALAQQVRAVVGTGVTDNWGGFKTFKALVMAAAPGINIVDSGPGMVIPRSQPIPKALLSDPHGANADLPPAIVNLRQFDKNLPAFTGERLRALYRALDCALDPATWEALNIDEHSCGIREINLLSRRARDTSEDAGQRVSRPNVDYVLKGLLWSGNLRPGLSSQQVQSFLTDWYVARCAKFGLIDDVVAARDEIAAWLATA